MVINVVVFLLEIYIVLETNYAPSFSYPKGAMNFLNAFENYILTANYNSQINKVALDNLKSSHRLGDRQILKTISASLPLIKTYPIDQ
jgi:hypothetical protein